LELNDGSFVSGSHDKTVKRWCITNTDSNRRTLQLVGTFVGHHSAVTSVAEIDNNTIVTLSSDKTLKVWNTTNYQCLDTLQTSFEVDCMMKTRDKLRIVCGSILNKTEMRRVSDLELVSSFNIPSYCIDELEDGTFLSGSYDSTVIRWTEEYGGTVLQRFKGHTQLIYNVLGLNSNAIVSVSRDGTLKMWDLTSAKCTQTRPYPCNSPGGIVKISRDRFVTGGLMMQVWDDKGNSLQCLDSGGSVMAMATLRNSILASVTNNIYVLTFWRFK